MFETAEAFDGGEDVGGGGLGQLEGLWVPVMPVGDPKTTLSGESGTNIPDTMNIGVYESDMRTVSLALPPYPNQTGEQLEAISAGLCSCW